MKAAHTQPTAGRQPARFALKFLTVAVCTAFIGACATDPRSGQPSFKQTFASQDPCSDNARNIGIVTGAIAGAILANQVKHSDRARIVGAMAGATIGGLIGKDMDDRRCALWKIARQYDLHLQTSTVSATGEVIADSSLKNNPKAVEIQKTAVGMVVEIRDRPGRGGHFESNSDRLTEQAQHYFAAIADSYNSRVQANNINDAKAKAEYIAQISKRKILLIGHTDDTGPSRFNADLAERRARAVADYMKNRGIPQESLYFQGAGEAYPIADNSTEEGRTQNRRVEIVEVANADAFNRFLADRKPRYEFYRPGEAQAPTPRPSAPASAPSPANGIDFGGSPLLVAGTADIGPLVAKKRSVFSLINSAYADEPPIVADCSRDRPRAAHGVKALADGKTYRTSEHLPGLYGKTWADQVNGHLVVLNKVAVLAGEGAAANLPEFKVYTSYDPARGATAMPALSVTPEVNTYLGNKGLLYRLFLNGRGGLSCVDVVFSTDGGTVAKKGSLVYWRNARLMSADFKPGIHQK
ncbi:OmpA family protein [Duganella sp. PWIR1]